MTTTARAAIRHIVKVTAALAASVLAALFDACQLCGQPAAYLFERLTEDYEPVRACETCVDTHHLGYAAD